MTLEGTIERTTYHHAESRYTVLRMLVRGRPELVTLVGRTEAVEDDADVTVTGEWTSHPRHGEQFAFDRLVVKAPRTPAGIRRRLMLYPGIREVMADRIVARFGHDTLDVIDRQPRRLLEVEGIGPKTYARIVEYHASRSGPVAELENQLLELDLAPGLARAIHRRFGDEALSVLREHPYRLAREVRGIGFLTADRIARALGVDLDGDERVDAGIVHVLEQAQLDGHCALAPGALTLAAVRLLGLPEPRIEAGLERLVAEGALVEHGRGDASLLFRRELWQAEVDVAAALSGIALGEHASWRVDALPPELSEGQAEALRAVACHGVVVLTGGPGTGKSTVVRHVIDLALRNDLPLHLAAPTGRAAKRLEQATGMPAKTVHRLLEIQGDSGLFVHGPHDPLPPGLVVVDEVSMLDIELAQALFSALTPAHRLLLVGDADQLPSVGPGNLLRDLLAASSGPHSAIQVVRLHKIFRQAEGSSIVVNAHRILAGRELVPDAPGPDAQFFVVRAADAGRVHELVVKLTSERIPAVYGLDPKLDVQVLCPMHKGRAGTEAFNHALQAIYRAGSPALEVTGAGLGGRRFYLGDRVMQTRNDYQRGVFNGDIGTVVAIDAEDRALSVDMDGARIWCEGRELAALQLAYAVSIHKSQGSEFPAVVVPVLAEHHVMLRRNLLYTAVTRARRLCIVVGDPRAIERAIRRSDAAHRNTGLAARLSATLADRLGALVYEPD